MYRVYIKTDITGRIISVNSDAFLPDTDGWVEIDSGDGDKFHHAQGNYLPKPLMTNEGVYRYKVVKGKVTERTAEEIQADIDAMQAARDAPTAEERLAAIEGVIDRLRDAMAGNALLRALVDKIWPDDAARKEGET